MPIYAVQLKMVRDPSVQMGVTLLLHSIQFSKIFETEVHHSQKVINPSMMKILCFHGRGSNVQIFQLQTAAIRADLEDFDFEFIQGTVRHTEGNWSLFTTSFSDQPLYGYYNPISAASIAQTETELLDIVENEGPFDGVMGYSGGAGLAAQLIIRDQERYPDKMPSERPFRFAIFFNGTTPFRIFKLAEENVKPGEAPADSMIEEAHKVLMRTSAVRKKEEISDEDRQGHDTMLSLIDGFTTRQLETGQYFISDGTYGIYRYSLQDNGGDYLLRIPTLHVRDPGEDEDDVNHGLNLLGICDPEFVREFNHSYGHDFPRGRKEIKAISQLIRETAQDSLFV